MALFRCLSEGQGKGEGKRKKADVVVSVNVKLSETGGEEERRRVEEWFGRGVGGLRVEDWGLFGDE